MKPSENIESTMERLVTGQLVRFAASVHITCPSCGRILDCRQTVVAHVEGRLPDETDNRVLLSITLCAGCHDRNVATIKRAVEEIRRQKPGAVVDLTVLDGRVAFADALQSSADARPKDGPGSSLACN
jgi:hypothetical protein